MIDLNEEYYQKLYSGILGKMIGVYLGRPIEGWVNSEIVDKFGEINRYVHQQLHHPLICSDDDLTGTFVFPFSLIDHDFNPEFSAEHIGKTWLDYLIENKTVLWWGGYGQSTEHTAYLNLKSGIPAPQSGAISTNGKTAAEQIGGQIFIDGWAMLNPGNPNEAARLAKNAASVSHDGEAIHAAVVIAVMQSQAFIERDIQKLIDLALTYISADSRVAALIADVRQWHNTHPKDWSWAFSQLKDKYGYDKYHGTCHVIPNHGLIILSLLYGGESFNESMKIVNTLGWDTDCNAANLGCLNGIRLGLSSLDDGYNWREPIADRLLLPTASMQDHIFDAVQLTDRFFELATYYHHQKWIPRKAKFHFSLPRSLQGFSVDKSPEFSPTVNIDNEYGALDIHYKNLVNGVPARVKTATHTDLDYKVNESSYHVIGSPTLYSGQRVSCKLSLIQTSQRIRTRLFVEAFDTKLSISTYCSESVIISTTNSEQIDWVIPDVGNRMISSLGIELLHTAQDVHAKSGTVRVHEINWSGTPTLTIGIDESPIHEIWESSFINTMTTKIKFNNQAIYRLANNHSDVPGLFVFGSNEWRDYHFSIKLTPQVKHAFGAVIRYQGLTRYYSAQLQKNNKLQLIKHHFDEATVIATVSFEWEPHHDYLFEIVVKGEQFICSINHQELLVCSDSGIPNTLLSGGAGFLIQLGTVHFTNMSIKAVDQSLEV